MDLERKKENSTRDFVRELKDALLVKREKGAEKLPPVKKDKYFSIFKGKPFLSKGDFEKKIEADPGGHIYKKTNIGLAERKDLSKKIPLNKFGSGIDPHEVGGIKKELALGKFGGYGGLSQTVKKKIEKIIDAIPEEEN